MIGLLLIYWIWKAFSNLAIEHDKNKWAYFVIGIVAYYGGTALAGFILGILFVLVEGLGSVDENGFNPGWNILFVLCGALCCYGVYILLEGRLQKEINLTEEGIEDIGSVDEN